ncbi:outer membrane beta-barrel protein [Microbulbifer guangxiensis]|uniref:outer membrane beta-barrel protein n=1 Tax=Microbulbifer guangxiensis TaxID=2904249 RepID=UPI001F2108B1|nr:outer membrane beta-barrel protein [Microbulbifer guangxiensis]
MPLLFALTAGLAISPFVSAEPIALPAGVTFTPSVGVDLRYDDNIDNAPFNEVESWLMVATPRLLLEADTGISQYSLQYSLSHGDYLNADRDSYTDQELLAGANWDLHPRHGVEVNLVFRDIQQEFNDRVAPDLESLIFERDRYIEKDFSTTYRFGADGARGRLEFTIGHNDRNYIEELRAQDRRGAYGSGLFRFNIAGETNLLARLDARDIDYRRLPGLPILDSREVNYLVGAERETPVLTLSLLAGLGTRMFDDPAEDDFTRPRWEFLAAWRPLEITELTLTSDRVALESRGLARLIDARSASVAWRHEWTETISTQLSFRYTDADFEGTDLTENIRRTFGSVDYRFLEWLTLRAGVSALNQDATQPVFAYDRNQAFIGFEASL